VVFHRTYRVLCPIVVLYVVQPLNEEIKAVEKKLGGLGFEFGMCRVLDHFPLDLDRLKQKLGVQVKPRQKPHQRVEGCGPCMGKFGFELVKPLVLRVRD